MNANVSNYSSEKLRRVDLTFKAAGSEDITKVQDTILGAVAKCEKALQDPAPFAAPVGGVPGGLEYTVRVWTESANYWDVYFEMNRRLLLELPQEGIVFAFPHMDVRMRDREAPGA